MMEEPVIEKVKRKRRDRRKPENMSVTTGKYKSKRTKKLD
jgi:hypothetical protein